MRLRLRWRGGWIEARDRPLVMGILNVTPDSFSDGGRFVSVDAAVAHALAMVDDGADLVDVGGESTRPGAGAVPVAEEAERVVPVVRALVEAGVSVPISVDTRRAVVARQALAAGAAMVNDVSALGDPKMGGLVAAEGVPVVLMHMKGEPGTMQVAPHYEDVVQEVLEALGAVRDRALALGVRRDQIVLDPGLGFGKRTGAGVEDNCDLLSGLPDLLALGCPLLVGASRKRFLGHLGGAATNGRLPSSLAAALAATWGGASILRVHDVAETVQAVRVAARLDPTGWSCFWAREQLEQK